MTTHGELGEPVRSIAGRQREVIRSVERDFSANDRHAGTIANVAEQRALCMSYRRVNDNSDEENKQPNLLNWRLPESIESERS